MKYLTRTGCLFLVLSTFLSSLKAQFNSELLKYSYYKRHVSAYSEFEFNSNHLPNSFVEKFYRGGYIDSAEKRAAQEHLKIRNYFGGSFSSGVNAIFGKDSSSIAWLVGIKNQTILNAGYTNDFFNLVFNGNSMYKGQRVYMPNMSLNYLHFQEVKLGFVWTNVDTVGKIGGALSFLKGQNLLQFKTTDTNYLYTAPDATQLELYASFNLTTSDSMRKTIFDMNGVGISGDFYVETPYKSKLGPSKFIVSVNNLGFIRWNKQSNIYSVDSLFTYDGIHINNLTDLKDSTLLSAQRDSLLSTITSYKKEYVNTNLPMNFIILHETELSKRISLVLGLRHIFNGNYKPFGFAEGRFKLNSSLSCNIMFAHGGYGTFTSGLSFECKFKKTWIVKIGSQSVQGFVAKKKTRGESLYFTLCKTFR